MTIHREPMAEVELGIHRAEEVPARVLAGVPTRITAAPARVAEQARAAEPRKVVAATPTLTCKHSPFGGFVSPLKRN